MRLLSLSDMDPPSGDRVFAYSRISAVIFTLALLGGSAGAVFLGHKVASSIPYYVAGALLLILLLYRDYVTAHFRPTNWLVRMTSDGLFIKFRSYLNYRLPDDDIQIVFLAYREIRSACLVRVRSAVSNMDGGTSVQTLRYVEFELAGETAALEQALKIELATPAPRIKRWYGTSSTLFSDYPLSIATPPFLRVRWSVTPGASAFLEALRPYTAITEPVSLSEDFTALSALPRSEQEKRLQALDARGETITAIYMARQLFGTSLTDATNLVESWRLRTSAPS